MTTIVLEMESLEDLEERTARVLAREEADEEAMLEELIRAMVRAEPLEAEEVPGEESGDEFTCHVCHLILCRSRLADEDEMLCADCATEWPRYRRSGGEESGARSARLSARSPACSPCG